MEDCPSNQNGKKGRCEHGEGRYEDGERDRCECGQTMGRQVWSLGRQAHPLWYVVRAEASLSLQEQREGFEVSTTWATGERKTKNLCLLN